MMSSKDIETARFMAEVWKLNDERNKRIEAEKAMSTPPALTEEMRKSIKELAKRLYPAIKRHRFMKPIMEKILRKK